MPLGAWLLLPVVAAARLWAADDLPDAAQPPCGQGFRVCDPDGLLRDTSRLERAIVALEADYEYPGCGGYEMGVVAVGRMRGTSTAEFAREVMDSWGVGKSACNNGILLAMAIDDRQLFIATGRGAKEYVPDRELEAVVDRMKPLMRAGEYADAAEQCVSDVARILGGESFAPSHWPGVLMLLGFGGFALVSMWRKAEETRRYTECKKKLMEIDRQRSQARANQYQQTSCAICLESFSDTAQLQVEVLVCGHKFHRDCMASWADRSGTCPICRQSTEDPLGTAPSGPPSTSGSSANGSFARRPLADSAFEDEYRFRLRRARHLYPRYVSDSMVTRWSRPDHCGQLVADTAFIRSSPSYSEPGLSGGCGGSDGGGGFGGGCSSGGGGAGGGW